MKEFTYRKIFLLAAPLMVGTFVQSIVTFTDAIFVSNLGEINIGAFGNGSLLYVALFMFSRGLADGTQIIIARLNGEENYSAIGKAFINAQVYHIFISLILFSFLQLFAHKITASISESPAVASAMNDFLSIRGFGLFFAAQHMALVGFFMGLGKTRVILYSVLLIATSNIFLDNVLINGNELIAPMGLKGAPLASTISEALGFIYLFIYLLIKPSLKKFNYNFDRTKIRLKEYLHVLKLSFPLMLQGVFSLSTWLVFFTLVEHMGTSALETAHNIRYMYFLAFVPIFGFAASTKTIVSTLVGQGNQLDIPKVQSRIILLILIFMVTIFHGAILYPETLIRLIDQNPSIAPQVMADSTFILQFISGSIIIYAITVVFFNSISGVGKTQISFFIEVIAIILYLTGCYFFFIHWNWNIRQVWWVEYIYFGSMGICSFAYFKFYHNKYHINAT
ncbi:MATE family efflux transporter [Crocinitomix algicola]|uniref:MATE family efflux transporter n=1 Tax=Crocinitomix algicola TaxID=1740263 RepID=UPI0008728CA9|nr:MATE family efflux transporter [Crocinitomix algicola]